MEKPTTIQITKETLKKLNILKIKHEIKNFDELMLFLIERYQYTEVDVEQLERDILMEEAFKLKYGIKEE